MRLQQLASLIVEGHGFSAVINELKLAFPATDIRPLPVVEILGRLEKIHPGLIKTATDLAGPSTLLQVTPSECPTAAATGAASILVVRNDTGAELTVKKENGETVEVPTGEFREVHGKSGQKVMLPTNRCLVFASEPRLAVLEKEKQEAVKESSFPKGTPTGFGVARSFSVCWVSTHAVFQACLWVFLPKKGLIGSLATVQSRPRRYQATAAAFSLL